MQVNNSRAILLLILCAISSLWLTSCSQIRKLTYPENFTYITKKDLRNSMHQLNTRLVFLESLFPVDTSPRLEIKKKVIEELDKISLIATEIRGKNEQTNHLVIDDHLDQFLSDISRAKLQVEANPPNYYYAGKITGSCSGCHRYR